MSESPDLGPLNLLHDGSVWRFTLGQPSDVTLEVPPDYDQRLTEALGSVIDANDTSPAVIDLEGVPAISSRQLGLMLALRRTLYRRGEALRIIGLSDGVRRLLELTRTEQFFQFD